MLVHLLSNLMCVVSAKVNSLVHEMCILYWYLSVHSKNDQSGCIIQSTATTDKNFPFRSIRTHLLLSYSRRYYTLHSVGRCCDNSYKFYPGHSSSSDQTRPFLQRLAIPNIYCNQHVEWLHCLVGLKI
jgi:hypothetical protein